MSCNGLCKTYKFSKKNTGSHQFYYAGASRCQVCEEFIKWDGIYCPCCNTKLRKKPRNKHGKVAVEKMDETRVDRKEKFEPLIKVKR